MSQESRLMYYYHGELWVDHAVGAAALSPAEFRFTGKEFDKKTGFYYYRARYLDPTADLLKYSSLDAIPTRESQAQLAGDFAQLYSSLS